MKKLTISQKLMIKQLYNNPFIYARQFSTTNYICSDINNNKSNYYSMYNNIIKDMNSSLSNKNDLFLTNTVFKINSNEIIQDNLKDNLIPNKVDKIISKHANLRHCVEGSLIKKTILSDSLLLNCKNQNNKHFINESQDSKINKSNLQDTIEKNKASKNLHDSICTNENNNFLKKPLHSETAHYQHTNQLTHIDPKTGSRMVEVSDKEMSTRIAVAKCIVHLPKHTFDLIKTGSSKKGDVLSVAQLAGIMAAKKTSNLIPLCHNIVLDGVNVILVLNEEKFSVEITSTVKCIGRTGVEMEALMAVSVAALTVYDMCKASSHNIVITDIRLEEKLGGKSGHYQRKYSIDN